MDRDKLLRRLRATFLAELQDHIASMNRLLLALDRDPGGAKPVLQELYRVAHSVKGAARSVNLPSVESCCHALEGELDDALKSAKAPSADVVRRWFASADALKEAERCLREGREPPVDLTAAAAPPAAGMEGLRVSPEQADRLVRAAGELMLARRRLGVAEMSRDLAERLRALHTAAAEVEAGILELRTVPVGSIGVDLERAAHDLARSLGKRLEWSIEGADVRLDRAVLEALSDPLRHLVRNAVDHGVGPNGGRVRLTAAAEGTRVSLSVSDNGRGIDLEAVREAAGVRGMPLPETMDEAARMLFMAGFTTAREVSPVSGRGIGLDVVRSRVEAVHGTVTLVSEPGRGTSVRISVPATLALVRALIVSAGGRTVAIPTGAVARVIRVRRENRKVVEGRPRLAIDGRLPPLARLAEVLGVPGGVDREPAPAALLTDGSREAALIVDEALDEQEVMVHPVPEARFWSVATVLPDGRPAPLLNPAELIRAAERAAAPTAEAAQALRRRILLVEDSRTTRALEKGILESAGFEVDTAADGAEAWRRLQHHPADLVVTDIEMPNMDGLALTRAIRGSARFRDLPVILVTAKANDEDRARGVEAGADAHIVKQSFEQKELIEAIRKVLR